MQVNELVDVARFFREFIKNRQLPSLYKRLTTALTQAAQNQNPQDVQPALDNLIALHSEADKHVLSPAQAKLLADYGGDRLFGQPAIDRINSVFDKHRGHPQGIIEGISALMQETNQFASRADQLVTAVEPMLGIGGEEPQLGPDEGKLWLYFAEAASVETIEELEKAAETWKQILHHFSRLPDVGPTPGRLLAIVKHSPLEIEISAAYALLIPLAFGIQWGLSRVEHVIKILQEAERLKQLKVKTKTVKALKEEADELRSVIASEGADNVIEKYGGDNEVRNAIEQALTKVIAFIEKGGQLDIDIPAEQEDSEPSGEDQPRQQLRAMLERIRKDIKLLPPPGTGNADKSGDDEAT